MDLMNVLDQARDLLQKKGRITYRMLKAQFQLDNEAMDALREELIEGERVAVDEDGKVLGVVGTDQRSKRRKGETAKKTVRSSESGGRSQNQSLTPRNTWPSAFGPNKRRWKHGEQVMVSARRSPRCLLISKARRR